eukprot:8811683-Pyramimonas_sp.AAC.2
MARTWSSRSSASVSPANHARGISPSLHKQTTKHLVSTSSAPRQHLVSTRRHTPSARTPSS